MREAIRLIAEATGEPPLGWYTGRSRAYARARPPMAASSTSDSYADDLPYWEKVGERPLLIVPYTLDANDMRFVTAQGFNSGEQFFAYLRDAFDVLYAEGETAPKMISVGLHCRLAGRPGRAAGLEALSRLHRRVRSGLGRLAARYRAPLASRASRSRCLSAKSIA